MLNEKKDYTSNTDFTVKARQKVDEVIKDPYFLTADSDSSLIFELLYSKIRQVYFGDYLRRYIYKRAGLNGNYLDIPVAKFQDIICEEFSKRQTPCDEAGK